MKKLLVTLVLLSGLSTMSCFANDSETFAVGSFRYIDVNQAESELAVSNELAAFNEAQFVFLLNETLAMKTTLSMVEENKADRVVIGRVTKLNEAGDARIEIAFVNDGVGLDGASDMVALEVTLDDSEDAMLALVDDVYHMVYLSLNSDASFNRREGIAGH